MHFKPLLTAATELLRAALSFQHPADGTAARFFKEQRALGPRERALLSDMLYAVLRRKTAFEALAKSAPEATQPVARRLALLGLQQVLAQRDAATRDSFTAALSADEQAWLVECSKVEHPSGPQRHNLPAWLADALSAQVGEEFDALADALNDTAPLDVRVNPLKTPLKKAQAALQAEFGTDAVQPLAHAPQGLRLLAKPNVTKSPLYAAGEIEVQDEGSQLLALLADAKRNQVVVDFCAGAGGKTLAMGAAMRGTGRLYAWDTSAHRLDALAPRLTRSGLANVHTSVLANEQDERILRLAGKADVVLVDAPCSGLGTLRRSPDLKWRQKPGDVAELAALQLRILQSAARLVKPGGRLVYATCSVLTTENEEVAFAFDGAQRDFAPLPVADELARLKVHDAASLCSADGRFLRLWPHRHGTDGFFAAVWTRRS